MEDPKPPKITLPSEEEQFSPAIRHTPIKEVEIVHVLRSDLTSLKSASSKETRATVFFGILAGVFASSLLAWLGIDFAKSYAVAFLAMANLSSLALTIWFGLEWKSASDDKKKFLAEIEDKSISSRALIETKHPN